jgi:lysophospholipase L1-like esterase
LKFDIYFAIGDSMSIDFYPAQDAEASGITVREDIGAAALFHHNESDMFPEFSGMDLASFFPKIHYKNIAEDGNTCGGVINRLAAMDLSTSPEVCALITLTVGGNDLLSAYRASVGKEKGVLQEEILRIQTEYDHVVFLAKSLFNNYRLILSTVFDPTDGTGIMPMSTPIYNGRLPIEFLDQFNDHIRAHSNDPTVSVADVHKHFLGHGAECNSADEFWYWKASPIEPSYKGASEIRRVWLESVKSLGSDK